MRVYTKTEMISVLTSVSNHLSQYTDRFPELISVVLELANTAKSLNHRNGTKASKAAQPKKRSKSAILTYTEDTIIVRGIPWGMVGKRVKLAFNKIANKVSNTINPETGKLYFLSCYDKKAKGFCLPRERESEVLDILMKEELL